MAVNRSNRSDEELEEDMPLHDEEEEEDYDDDEEDVRPTKKKYNPFIDEMAIVDDDEDDEEEDEEYGREDGFIEEEESEELATAKTTARRHLDLDRRRREMEGMDDEQVAAFYAEKYGARHRAQPFKDTEEVPRQLLLPSVNDPNLWMVKCKPGKERDIISGLMKRYFDRQNGHHALETFSAFARESLKGYIYIEARKQAHVQEALSNIPNIYMTTLMLVPIKDMVDAITVQKKDFEIPTGGWVRIKRGTYQGDLAQVVQVADSQDSARLKVVPRLDLETDETNGKRKKSARPPPRLFNPERLANRSISSLQKKGPFWIYNGDYYRDGYLIKSMRAAAIQVEDVNPTLDEIARFTGDGDGEDVERQMASLSNLALTQAQVFQNGDVVKVVEGDMIHSSGIVEIVKDTSVTVMLDMDGAKKRVTLPARQLRKKFNEGDHVKVINGRYKDESGLVVKIQDNIITLLSDASLKEVRVFAKDLREAAEVNFGKTVIGNYELHDLVQLDFYTVGVIVKVNRDTFQVLTQNNELRTVEPHQITNKRDSRRAVATDANGNSVRSGDTVMEVGNISRRNCSVLHLYRHLAFLHSREQTENYGVWVANTRSIISASARGRELSTPKPQLQSSSLYNNGSSRGGRDNAAAVRGGRGGRGGGRGGFYGRGGGRDNLVAKTVRISQGPHKGYIGIVKDTTDTHARVELHTNSKVLTIDKAHLMVLDSQGNTIGQAAPDRFESPAHFARPMATPSRYGADPSGAMTPMYNASGARTPAWNSGSKTPAWNSGARTPNPYTGNDGSKTPAWDSGSKTPAWDSGSKTPTWRSETSSAWSSSSSSNHHRDNPSMSTSANNSNSNSNSNASSRKPAYSSSNSRYSHHSTTATTEAAETAPTPAPPTWSSSATALSTTAPTPAASHFDARAPTPAVNFAQTPYESAPTPYESAPTPAVHTAPTPAPTSSMLSAPTPGNYFPTTPGNFMPTTPATGLPQTPFMPSGGDYGQLDEQEEESEDNWPMEDIEVTFKKSQNDINKDQHGKIIGVNRASRTCTVLVIDSDKQTETPFDGLEPVRPSKKDGVKIILGEFRGQLGSLIGVDSHDGIVRLKGGGSGFKILSMNSVAKYAGNETVD
ncbi:MAG: hypothetical protein EXX96DRAFT_590896 [Benjaminiella poitrasii]|nr:MAG: hypothetical protein EXX96DRAFT_590896 [Benjaminiella poitrasii]